MSSFGITRKAGDVLIVVHEPSGARIAIDFLEIRGGRARLSIAGNRAIKVLRKSSFEQVTAGHGGTLPLKKPNQPD